MINLFEYFDSKTKTLLESLQLSGHNHLTIVMEDDGFLPDNICTPYRFFSNNRITQYNKPRFFNDIDIPQYWEIEGNNEIAWIKNMGEVKGKIIYKQHFKYRVVKDVEWFDNQGRVRFIDHYTKEGIQFSQTIMDINGTPILKKYKDQQGKEIIYENYITNDIVVEWQGKSYFFDNKSAFIMFLLKIMNIDQNTFLINSLSTPFTVLYNLQRPGNDVLYWQEHCGGDIPGNMKLIWGNTMVRKVNIIVPERAEYDLIMQNIDEGAKKHLNLGGYIYHYHKKNNYSNNVLTMTNSDQLANIETIIQKCPEIIFYIGAVTEMSSKLTSLEKYSNVKLFPTIDKTTIEALYNKCDVYLDINDGGEILNAVSKAFKYDMLIVGYENIAHNVAFTLPELLVTKENQSQELINILKKIYKDDKNFLTLHSMQKKYTNEISVYKFNRIFEESINKKPHSEN